MKINTRRIASLVRADRSQRRAFHFPSSLRRANPQLSTIIHFQPVDYPHCPLKSTDKRFSSHWRRPFRRIPLVQKSRSGFAPEKRAGPLHFTHQAQRPAIARKRFSAGFAGRGRIAPFVQINVHLRAANVNAQNRSKLFISYGLRNFSFMNLKTNCADKLSVPAAAVDPRIFPCILSSQLWGRTGFDLGNAPGVACRGWYVGLVNHRTKTQKLTKN